MTTSRIHYVFIAAVGVAASSCGGSKPPVIPGEIHALPSSGLHVAALRTAIEAGQGDEADNLVKQLTPAEKASFSGRVLIGRVAELHGAGTDAKNAYEGVLGDEPGHLEASLALGVRLLEEGDTKAALAVTDRGLGAHVNEPSLMLNRAYIVLASDGFPLASEAFLAAEKASGGSGVVRISFASALVKSSRPKEAIEVLNRVATDARSAVGELAEAGHELRQLSMFAAALVAFDRVVERRDGGEIRVERALCKLGLRDGEAAIKEIEAGIRVEPTWAPLYFYKGGRLAEGHRWKDAFEAYEKYILLAPGGPLADMAKKRLRMIAATIEK